MSNEKTQTLITYVSLTKDFVKDVILPILKKISSKVFEAIIGCVSTILSGVGFIISIVELIFSIDSYFNALSDLKKARNLCYGMYRRIKMLIKADANELCYKQISNLLNNAQNHLENLANRVKQNDKNVIEMEKKYFVPCEFNSFVLTTNILSWIDTNQIMLTVRNGSISDYVKFVSIIDYIDTKKVFEQDKVRIKTFIFENNVDMLNIFALNLEYLQNEIQDRLNKKQSLTDFTINDLKFIKAKTSELLSLFSDELLHNLQEQNNSISKDVVSLFSSIYRYLDFGYVMKNTYLDTYTSFIHNVYCKQNIEEYCKNFPEYPIYLFQNYFTYFGNVMYNNIYISNYQKQILQTLEQNISLYSKELVNQIKGFFEYSNNIEKEYLNILFLENFINEFISGKIYEFENFYSGTYKIEDEKLKLHYCQTEYTPFKINEVIEKTIKDNSFNLEIKSLPETLYFGKYDKIKFESSEFIKNYVPFSAAINSIKEFSIVGTYSGDWWDSRSDSLYNFDLSYSTSDNFQTLKTKYDFARGQYINTYYNYSCTKEQITFIKKGNRAVINKNVYENIKSNIDFYNSVSTNRNYNIKTDVIEFIKKYPTFDDYYYSLFITKSGFMLSLLSFVSHFSGSGMTDGEARFRSALCLPDGFGNDRFNEAKQQGRNYYFYDRNWYEALKNHLQFGQYKQQVIDLFSPYTYWQQRKEIYDKIQTDLQNLTAYKNELSYLILQPEIANPEYNAILSQVETTRDNQYIFNLFKEVINLLKSNIGFYQKTKQINFPCYKTDGYNVWIVSYVNIYDILNRAYNRTGLTSMFYLLNKKSLDKLFEYASGNFQNKIDMYNYYKQITPDYTEIIIKYQKGIELIENNFLKRIKSVNIDTIYESMQDELITKEVSENEKVIKNIEQKTNNTIDSDKLISYTMYGLIGTLIYKKLFK